jgi:hypothetical protein
MPRHNLIQSSHVCNVAFSFLSKPRYNHKTGEWAHTTRLTRFPERKWLSNFDITSNTAPPPFESEQEQAPSPYAAEGPHRDARGASSVGSEVARALAVWAVPSPSALMKEMSILAKAELQKVQSARKKRKGGKPSGNGDVSLSAFEDVRWFVTTSDPEISLEGDDIEQSKETQAVITGTLNVLICYSGVTLHDIRPFAMYNLYHVLAASLETL